MAPTYITGFASVSAMTVATPIRLTVREHATGNIPTLSHIAKSTCIAWETLTCTQGSAFTSVTQQSAGTFLHLTVQP